MFDLYGKTRNTTTPESAYLGKSLWAKVEGVDYAQSFGSNPVPGALGSTEDVEHQPEQSFFELVQALFTKKAA